MNRFPKITAAGSHREVGIAIGSTLKEQIKLRLEKNRKLSGSEYETMLTSIQPYLDSATQYFPQYIEEIHGIATGADVSFHELFLGNTMELFNADQQTINQNHCTIAAAPSNGTYVLGHNEDAQGYSFSDLYVLDATIDGTKVFGISYIDGIIGSSVAVNGFGLIQAINSLPSDEKPTGVPRNIIARAILDCKTLSEAEQLLTTIPRASGYNHVLVQQNEAWNIESSSDQIRTQKIQGQPFVHTNHYLTDIEHPAILEINRIHSHNRFDMATQLIADVTNASEMKLLLRRDLIDNDHTIGSAVIDLNASCVYLCCGRPGMTN